MLLAQVPRKRYLRCNDDDTISVWMVIRETETDYVVGSLTSNPKQIQFENQILLSKKKYKEATEEEYWEEIWATEVRGYYIGALYKKDRVPFRFMKEIAKMLGKDVEKEVRETRR